MGCNLIAVRYMLNDKDLLYVKAKIRMMVNTDILLCLAMISYFEELMQKIDMN